MSRNLVLFIIISTGLLGSSWIVVTHASPPSPTFIDVQQSDGTKVKLKLRGNEWYNWYEDEQGFTVLFVPERFAYALRNVHGELVATSLLVGEVDPERSGLAKGLTPSPEFMRKMSDTPSKEAPQLPATQTAPIEKVIKAFQPNGTEVQLHARRPEWLGWFEDERGYAVLKSPASYVYAVRDRTGELVHTTLHAGVDDPHLAGLQKAITPSDEALTRRRDERDR